MAFPPCPLLRILPVTSAELDASGIGWPSGWTSALKESLGKVAAARANLSFAPAKAGEAFHLFVAR